MSPIDSADPSRSKTASHVTPLLTLLNTPPDAVPTKIVEGFVGTASMSSMRPPNDEGPMWRQAIPSTAGNFAGWLRATGGQAVMNMIARAIGEWLHARSGMIVSSLHAQTRRGALQH